MSVCQWCLLCNQYFRISLLPVAWHNSVYFHILTLCTQIVLDRGHRQTVPAGINTNCFHSTEKFSISILVLISNCHNPTYNPKQLKTTFVGVVLLSVKNPPPPVLDNLRSWFWVCNLILTQLDEIWKTTSIFLKMEDDLNYFENGRRPKKKWKWKTT